MEDIREQLRLIDQQLAARKNPVSTLVTTCPLLFAASGLIAGIVIQDALPESFISNKLLPTIWLAILLISCATAIVVYLRQSEKPSPQVIAMIVVVCFICLGAIRLDVSRRGRPNDISNLVKESSMLATIRGTIVTQPRTGAKSDSPFANFEHYDPSASFYLDVTEVQATTGWHNATGTVRVQVNTPVMDLKPGDHILLYCKLSRFEPPSNPGQFDIARYLACRNVFVAASVRSRDAIELLQHENTSVFIKFKNRISSFTASALLGDLDEYDQRRAILQALLLGQRGQIDSVTYAAFRKTGLLHLVSLSGLHLGILVAAVWYLCRFTPLLKKGRAVICLIALVLFLTVIPPRAPTLRAAIICAVLCLSYIFRRKPSSINTLSLAAIILLLARPTQLFEPGWQLSFTSVLGIVIFSRPILSLIHRRIPLLFNKSNYPKHPALYLSVKAASYLADLIAVGLAAWLGGAGILLYHFYTVNPLAFLWTALTLPLVTIILMLGLVKIIIAIAIPSLAAVLALVLASLTDVLIVIVKFFASLDISEILIGSTHGIWIILFYALIIFAALAQLRRPRLKRNICTAAAAIIITALAVTNYNNTMPGELTLTVLDVGHGQTVVARLPGNRTLIFDAGSLYKKNLTAKVIAPYLVSQGVKTIDAIILSHNDLDHINAVPELAVFCPVEAIYVNNSFFSATKKYSTAKILSQSLANTGLDVTAYSDDLISNSKVTIKKLWPNVSISSDNLDDNDDSLVSLIEFGGRKIMLCSDIEKLAQQRILKQYPDLKPDVVLAAHHGSINTAEESFLPELAPQILIYSCSSVQHQRIKHYRPVPNASYFYTAEHGAVTVKITSQGKIAVKTFKKNSPRNMEAVSKNL